MSISCWLRRSWRVAVVLAFGATITGCMTVKSYVDPTLPVISSAQLPKVQQPGPATVLFEFKTKGNSNARATSEIGGRVVAAVAQSAMFGQLSTTVTDPNAGLLKITIDNVGDMGSAVAKGVGTGLTLGLAGSLVTDNYVCTATYSLRGKSYEASVHHALLSTIGNHSAPQGLTPMAPREAINQVVDQLVWHALDQLNKEYAFTTVASR
jgi:hypothetical protein